MCGNAMRHSAAAPCVQSRIRGRTPLATPTATTAIPRTLDEEARSGSGGGHGSSWRGGGRGQKSVRCLASSACARQVSDRRRRRIVPRCHRNGTHTLAGVAMRGGAMNCIASTNRDCRDWYNTARFHPSFHDQITKHC